MKAAFLKNGFLSTLLMLTLLGFFAGRARGQDIKPYGFAGDPVVNVLIRNQNSVVEQLGKSGNGIECVYFWELVSWPEDIEETEKPLISNPHLPLTNVRFFTAGSYDFRLTRVSKYGYQQEYVTVVVYDKITLTKAKLYNADKCFKAGDNVREDFFDLETLPPGYESSVFVSESDRSISGTGSLFGVVSYDKDIHFEIEGQEGVQEKTATIPVLTGTSVDYSVTVLDFRYDFEKKTATSLMEDVEDYLNSVRKYQKMLSDLSKGPNMIDKATKMAMIKDFFGLGWKTVKEIGVGLNVGFKSDCCSDRVMPYLTLGGELWFKYGFKYDQITPLTIPGIGGIGVRGSLAVKVDFFKGQPNFALATNYFKECFNVDKIVGVDIEGAIGATVYGGLAPGLFDISPQIGASIDLLGKISSENGFSLQLADEEPFKIFLKVDVDLGVNMEVWRLLLIPEIRRIK